MTTFFDGKSGTKRQKSAVAFSVNENKSRERATADARL
jgi:hypothetical protein